MFVGRRRELQQALRLLAGHAHPGVLITGMGRLGTSSLAARLANRCRDDLALVVLYGRFGIADLLERLAETLADYPSARDLVRAGRERVQAAQLTGEAAALLLLLDDFEQLLEETSGVRPLQARYVGLIATLLRAFDPRRTASRLLITSRFPFRLGPSGEPTLPSGSPGSSLPASTTPPRSAATCRPCARSRSSSPGPTRSCPVSPGTGSAHLPPPVSRRSRRAKPPR
jgi:hypothetical protein